MLYGTARDKLLAPLQPPISAMKSAYQKNVGVSIQGPTSTQPACGGGSRHFLLGASAAAGLAGLAGQVAVASVACVGRGKGHGNL
jgi:hypothetical protein